MRVRSSIAHTTVLKKGKWEEGGRLQPSAKKGKEGAKEK